MTSRLLYCAVRLGGAPQRVFPLFSSVRDLPLSDNLHKTRRHLKCKFAFPHEKSTERSSTFSSQHYHTPALKPTLHTKTYSVYLNILSAFSKLCLWLWKIMSWCWDTDVLWIAKSKRWLVRGFTRWQFLLLNLTTGRGANSMKHLRYISGPFQTAYS